MRPLREHSRFRVRLGMICLVPAIFALLFTVTKTASSNDISENILIEKQRKSIDYIKLSEKKSSWGNASIIKQNGDNNYASVAQSYSSAYQLANFSYIHQNGNGNQATILQLGANNIGNILQLGNNHKASILQKGNNFQANINQLGLSSNITLSQFGSGLRSISIEQQNNSGNALPVTIDNY